MQIFLYVVLAAFLLIGARRWFRRRSVPQIDPRAIPPGAVLLDVRTQAERSRDAIPGSIHIPLQEFAGRTGELAKYRSSLIVCYCRSGNRSMTAALRLRKLGYSAGSLAGGIPNWKLTAGKR